jgi:methylglyoxal synthase
MPTVALIAHDAKKDDLVNFARSHFPLLKRYRLIATETTGQRIQDATGLVVECKLPGTMGGDTQIAAEITQGDVIAVIFLIDPIYAQPHEPGTQVLMRVCNIHGVALALNLVTAEAIATHLAKMRLAYLIFNPISGSGNAEQDLSLIREMLEPHMHLEVCLTEADEPVELQVKAGIEAGANMILVSGGDGTVSAVATALTGTQIPLGIIPRGTANAFAVAVGIPRLQPIRSACQTILTGETRTVDIARCNGKPMVLLAGIGYEAETVERASRELKDQWGAMAYLMAGWQLLNEQEQFDAELEVEGNTYQFQTTAITVANAAPPTSVLAQGAGEVIMDDGLLDVTIATAETKLQAVTTMLTMLGAALVKLGPQQKNVIHGRTRKVKVTTEPPQKVVVDGEIIGTTPIEVECIPKGLTIFVPGS